MKAREGLGPGGAAELRGLTVSVWLGVLDALGVLGVAASRDDPQAESMSAASPVASSGTTLKRRMATT